MAKKKEAPASPFVPVEEQPYSIPENWCWVRFRDIVEIINGFAFRSEKYVDDGIRIIRIANVQDGYLEDNNPAFYPLDSEPDIQKYLLMDNDLLISLTGNVGRVAFLPSDMLPAALNQRVGCLRFNNARLEKKLLFFYMLRQEFQDSCIKNSKGTAQLNMSTEWLKEQSIPVPPLPEQHRIVTRIESLFVKLDEAKEKALAVVDGFELRKSAILHKAFTGELTERWRKEHGVGMDSWETKRINEITRPRAGYAFDSKKFTNSGYQIIRMGNLYGGELDLSRNPVFISLNDVDETALKRALVNSGDILITLTGTKYKRDYGYAVSIIDPTNLLVNQRILCLTPSQDAERNYILYYLRSNIFRDIFFSNETGGVNQGNVSSKFVENIEIKVPLLAEQHEIVTILDRVLDKEQHSKEAAEAVLDQIGTMKKAILARAFRGELGTNDPAEEWAGELVKTALLAKN